MRQIAQLAAEILLGMLAKSRLILLFTLAAIAALIWADRYMRAIGG